MYAERVEDATGRIVSKAKGLIDRVKSEVVGHAPIDIGAEPTIDDAPSPSGRALLRLRSSTRVPPVGESAAPQFEVAFALDWAQSSDLDLEARRCRRGLGPRPPVAHTASDWSGAVRTDPAGTRARTLICSPIANIRSAWPGSSASTSSRESSGFPSRRSTRALRRSGLRLGSRSPRS